MRFPCNDRTDEFNKLFIVWPLSNILKKNSIKTPEVIFLIRLRAQEVIQGHLFVAHTMLVFLSVIEKIVVPCPYFLLFFPTGSQLLLTTQKSRRAEKIFHSAGHYKIF